jgi:methyl-accepting chemotaxis protein
MTPSSPTPDRPHFRIKHYFIKKDFQFKFILKFCLLVFLGVIISTGLLFLFSQDTLTSSFDQSRLVIKKTAVAILPAAVYTNLITLGLITLATIMVTLFVSHKLAGPMFRFEADLKVIAEGDLTKVIRLRKKDQLMEIVDSLNQMTESLREKLTIVKDDLEQIRNTASEKGAPSELIEGLDKLDRKIKANFKI